MSAMRDTATHRDARTVRQAAPVSRRAGPLAGVRVVELAGIGPAPFAAMLLGDPDGR